MLREPRVVRLAFLLVGVACFAVACEPVPHYNRLQVAPLAGPVQKKPYGTVKFFRAADEVKRPYEVIGMMSCEGSASEEAGIINAMLYRAADMGADGVVLNPPKSGAEDVTDRRVTVQSGLEAFVLGPQDRRAYRAEAIRFK